MKKRNQLVRKTMFRRGYKRNRKSGRNPMILSRTSSPGLFESTYKFQRFVYGLLSLLLTSGIVYILFLSHFFIVQDVIIVGNKNIRTYDIRQKIDLFSQSKIAYLFPRRSFFLFPMQSLEAELFESFIHIESVHLQKQFPNIIRVVIVEKEPVIIWSTQQSYYLVDLLGRITGKTDENEIPQINLPVVIDESNRSVDPRDKVASPELVTFTKHMNELISEKTFLKISQIRMPSAIASEVHFITTEGTRIMFDPSNNVEDQIDVLNDLLNQEIKDKRKKIEYIDLRIKNWAYYK